MNYPPSPLNMPHPSPTALSPTHRLFPRLSNTHAFPGAPTTVYRPRPSAQEQHNHPENDTRQYSLYPQYRPYHPYRDLPQTDSRFIPEYDAPVQYSSVRDVQVRYPAYNIQVHSGAETSTIHPGYLGFHQSQPNAQPHEVTTVPSWMSYPTSRNIHSAGPGGVEICDAALAAPSAAMSATSSLPFMDTQPALFPGSGYSDDKGACRSNWNDPSGYALSPPNIADTAPTSSPIPMSTRESSPSPSIHASSRHDYNQPSPVYHHHYNHRDHITPAPTPGAGPSDHPNSYARSDPSSSQPYTRMSSQPSSSSTLASTSSPPAKKASKTHECSICHKVFPRPSALRTHMNTHDGLKRTHLTYTPSLPLVLKT